MDTTQVIYPMIAMFTLTLVVMALLFSARVASVRSGAVRASHFLTYSTDDAEPYRNLALSQNFKNQFEAPVLFYVVCLTVLITETQGPLFGGLAWGYVLMRLLHAGIHIGPNHLVLRIMAYMASWVFLVALSMELIIDVVAHFGGQILWHMSSMEWHFVLHFEC